MTIEQNNPLAGSEKTCLPPAIRTKPRLRRDEAVVYLEMMHGITLAVASLARMACHGGGPQYQKFNRSPLYLKADLDAWAAEKLGQPINNTSGASHD